MLNRRWKGATAAMAAVFMLSAPAAHAAWVEVDGTVLSKEQGWGENGTSYITLRALSQLGDYALSWDGEQARLEGGDLELTAEPGQPYIEVNGRALYVAEGVGSVEGKTYLPLRVVADATGGALDWDPQTATASLELEDCVPPRACYDEEGLYWLSRIISAESRGEKLRGQIAVGNVVLNRVAHENYPNTVKSVIFDDNYGVQFEPVANGTVYDEPTENSLLAAKLALEGTDIVGDCIYFYAPALSAGAWIRQNAEYYTTIGCHNFYRE